ncbi:MAG: DUF3144 domain-containing protein [Planctomycetes bacterium]|nr:DUF3144 domain-containing protein [Planctomycetota bacterium]
MGDLEGNVNEPEPPDAKFWELADSFISLANKHTAQTPKSRVSATLLYAASRFNSFVASSAYRAKADLVADREKIVGYFVAQYEKMLRDNLADHEENFKPPT